MPSLPPPPPADDGKEGRSTRSRFGDLRGVALGVVAWSAALVTLLVPTAATVVVLVAGSALVVVLRARGRLRWEHLGWLLVAAAVAGGALLRLEQTRSGVVPELARQGATVQAVGRVSTDPVLRQGRFADFVVLRATLTDVEARGSRWRTDVPVLVIAPPSWRSVDLGSRVGFAARLDRADDDDVAAVVLARGAPRVESGPSWAFRVADRVRAGVRHAAGDGATPAAALVPALVDGEDAALSEEVRSDFKIAGLTHLMAVSGTNLTLVVGALLLLARWTGVRARGLMVVGALGVVGFVLLARPEPSVLRAAAMGSVALLGMGEAGRERGTRALGLAVLVLMLLDPWLATEIGFALSATATAGILFLAPGWRDQMVRWVPRPVAEAVAVPVAAQLACTPLVAAISGQVSLVAVPANLLAAPVVGPVTVLGLLGGVLSAVWEPLGRPTGWLATGFARWLVLVAHHAAALPSAAVAWPVTPLSLLVLTGGCVWLAAVLGRLFARRLPSLAGAALAVLVVLVRVPTPGWPPDGWVLLACDVGQGDGLLLRAGPRSAVVVDAGPDPGLIDACLDRTGIDQVPLVVLSHFHADHVDGLPGVLQGREVGAIQVTGLAEPAGGAALVRRTARDAGVPVTATAAGDRGSVGDLRWQVLAPQGPPPADSDSPPNDASVVLLVEVRGVRILLMGDQEPGSQQRLEPLLTGQRVDVLKVAHHGSSKQDADLIEGLAPRVAVISDGVDNDYGHPAPSTLRLLGRVGAVVGRTDTDGDVAVVVEGDGGLRLAHRLPAVRPPPGGAG